MQASGNYTDLSDADLVARAAAGDREAFASLYDRYQAAIFRFALHMTGSRDVADDIVQEVFVALMRNLGRFDSQRSFPAYLYGIARRITVRRRSRDRRFVALEEGVEPAHGGRQPAFVDDIERRDHLELLRAAIVALPRRHREVIVMCDLQKMTYELAAASIGCAIGTVRSRLHRARALLGERLQRMHAQAGLASPRTPGYVI